VFELVIELPFLYSSGAAYSDCYISAPGCALSLPNLFEHIYYAVRKSQFNPIGQRKQTRKVPS